MKTFHRLRYVTIILLALITAGAFALAQLTGIGNKAYAAPSDVLYSEDFTDFAGETYGTAGPEHAVFKVTEGKLSPAGNTDNCAQSVIPDVTFTEDWSFTMTVNIPDGNIWMGFAVTGLFGGSDVTKFEVSSNQNCYAYIIDQANDGTYHNNNANVGGKLTTLTITRNTDLIYKVEKIGNVVRFYLGGNLLVEKLFIGTVAPKSAMVYSLYCAGATYDNISIEKKSVTLPTAVGDTVYAEDFGSYAYATYGEMNDAPDNKPVFPVSEGKLSSASGFSSSWLPIEKLPSDWQFSADYYLPAGTTVWAGVKVKGLFRERPAALTQFGIEQNVSNGYNGLYIIDSASGTDMRNTSPVTVIRGETFKVTIIKSGKQIQFKINENVIVSGTFTKTAAISAVQVYVANCTGATIDNISITVPEPLVTPKPDREFPKGVYVAESFNDLEEFDPYIDAESGFEGDGNGYIKSYKAELLTLGSFKADKTVSGKWNLGDADGVAGFWFKNGDDVIMGRISVNGATKTAEIGTFDNGTFVKTAGSDAEIKAGFNSLAFTESKASDKTVYTLTLNGAKAAEHEVDGVPADNTDVGIYASTGVLLEDLLAASNGYLADAAGGNKYSLTTDGAYIAKDFTADGELYAAGDFVPADGSENNGFVFDPTCSKIVSPGAVNYHASYWDMQSVNEFALSVKFRDYGTYSDGTRHVGGASFRVGSSFARYDLSVATDAADGGTQIDIWCADPSTKLLDYKSDTLGGGYAPALKLLPGEEYTLSLFFQTAGEKAYVTVFINETKVIQGYLNDIGQGGAGLRCWASDMEYDDFTVGPVPAKFPDGSTITDAPIQVIPVTEVVLSANAASVNVGESITFSVICGPLGATPVDIKWYLNDAVITGETGTTLALSEQAGEYRVKCVIDGVTSNVRTVTFVGEEKPKGCNCGSSIVGESVIFIAVAAVAIFAIMRKRKAN